MKSIVIIAIAVVCSIIGVLGILVVIDLISTASVEVSLTQDIADFCAFNYPTYVEYRNSCMQGNYLPSLFLQWVTAGKPTPKQSEIKFEQVPITETAPGGPKNAGVLGSEHSHAGISVKIFGDSFDFSAPAYQIKSPWIHFEGRDGTTVHKHATGVTLGYLFESLALGLDDQCFIFQDGRSFCSNDDYKLSFYVNGEQVTDIRDIEPKEDDKVLITYGAETPEEIQSQILELENQELIK